MSLTRQLGDQDPPTTMRFRGALPAPFQRDLAWEAVPGPAPWNVDPRGSSGCAGGERKGRASLAAAADKTICLEDQRGQRASY